MFSAIARVVPRRTPVLRGLMVHQGVDGGAGSSCRPIWQIKCATESALRKIVAMRNVASSGFLKAVRASSMVRQPVTLRISLPRCSSPSTASRLTHDFNRLFHRENSFSRGVAKDKVSRWSVSNSCFMPVLRLVIVVMRSLKGSLASMYSKSFAPE